MVWVIGIPIACFIVASVVLGVIGAYADVKSRPKEAMYWCAKHGAFRRKHVLPVGGMTEVCPMCFHQAWVDAGKEKK